MSGKTYEKAKVVAEAAEIRIRAERRIGELMKAQKEAGLMASGAAGLGYKGKSRVEEKPAITLAEVGIDKSLADRARKYAAVPEAEWEQELGDWRERENRTSTRPATTTGDGGGEIN